MDFIITQHQDGLYHVSLEHNRLLWETATTIEEALGKLILRLSEKGYPIDITYITYGGDNRDYESQ